jgi:hypothetical protein
MQVAGNAIGKLVLIESPTFLVYKLSYHSDPVASLKVCSIATHNR